MKVQAYTVNSFAKTSKGGNPAGVVLSADRFDDDTLQLIAKKIGFSETAFVFNSDVADFKVRFFSPIEEVDLCGHATIATYYTLFKKNLIIPGIYTQETKAGILNITINEDNSIFMEQTLPKFLDIINRHEIADSLNISVEDLHSSFEPQIVSTGLPDIMVPIKNLSTLQNISPDMGKVAKISNKYKTIGFHLFSLETLGGNVHTRNLAPLYGIPEEAATGTANGALACFLYKYGVFQNTSSFLTIEQGYTMDQPSEILVSLNTNNNIINSVFVGGSALNLNEVILQI